MANLTNGVLPVSIQQIGNNVDPATYPVFMALASYVYSANNDQYGEVLRHINTLKDRVTRAAFTAVVNCQRGRITETERDRYIEVLGNDRLRRSFKQLFNKSLSGIPALNLDFANGLDTLDSRITFTRASAATRTNAQGLIETTPVNLLTYSQDYSNVAWGKTNVSLLGSTTAPDGTNTATSCSFIYSSPIVRLYQDSSTTSVNGVVYTFSVYLRSSTPCTVYIGIQRSGPADQQSIAVNITPTWQRFTFTHSGVFSGSSAVRSVIFSQIDGFSANIDVWGAQLEQSSQASTYIPTTASISGAPRFDYDPVTLQPKGLLIEEQRTNLLSASQDFEAPVWTKSNATVNANCVVAPDGSLTGDKLVEDSLTNWHLATEVVSVTSGTVYTYTVYVKAAERTSAFIGLSNVSGTLQGTAFNLTGSGSTSYWGVFSAPTSSSITAVGNGWYRCSITVTAASTAGMECRVGAFTSGTPSYTGDGTSGIYIWGAQLEAGAFATSYVATPISFTSRASTATYYGSNGLIQTAAINTARYEPNSSGGSNLLLESAATNLLTRSEDFSDAVWTKTNATIAADAVTAPDGLNTADKLTKTATAFANVNQTATTTASTTYTVSAFFKSGTLSKASLTFISGTNDVRYWFDLASGTVGGAILSTGGYVGSGIQSFGNGWYRCWLSVTAQSTSANAYFYADKSDLAVAGDTYIWGAQLETGSVATSYIPTTTAQVTRAADVYSAPTVTRSADVAIMTGANFSSWYNSAEGSASIEYDCFGSVSGKFPYQISFAASGNNDVTLYHSGANGSAVQGSNAGSAQVFIGYSPYTAGAKRKSSITFKTNDVAFYVDGAIVGTDTSCAIPNLSQLCIGTDISSGNQLNGHIKRIAYYNKRLQDNELKALTS